MATTIKASAYIWIEFVLVLIGNLGMMFVAFFLKSPNLSTFIHPLFISLFITCTLFYFLVDSCSARTLFFLFLISLLDNLIPESEKTNIEKDISEQEDASIDHNEDNHAEASENNQTKIVETEENETVENNQNETVENQLNETAANNQTQNSDGSLEEKLNSFKFMTAIFVLTMWIKFATEGIAEHCDLRYYSYKKLINDAFFNFFSLATIQYVYGLFVLKDDPPKWLYFLYMVPQAVLYPLCSIISYYVAQNNYNNDQYIYNWNSSILVAFSLYYSFKMLHQFIQECKGENELKSKIFNIVMFAVGFLWLVFVRGIKTMNTQYDNDDYE